MTNGVTAPNVVGNVLLILVADKVFSGLFIMRQWHFLLALLSLAGSSEGGMIRNVRVGGVSSPKATEAKHAKNAVVTTVLMSGTP